MPQKIKNWAESLGHALLPIVLAGVLSLGTWIVKSINEQNIRLAEVLVEVKTLNEKMSQYATREELLTLQRKLEVHMAEHKRQR